MSKQQKKSLIPLISTVIVAFAAIAVVVVALLLINGESKTPSQGSGTSDITSDTSAFKPTQELVEECTYAAHDLVANNYRVVRLFITEGLAHEDEPYGNLPEDGLYTVKDNEYKTLEQIEELVNSVFIEEEAVRVLGNIDGKGLAVYQNREKLVKVEADPTTAETTSEATAEAEDSGIKYETEYVLGISADFAPAADYTKDWSSCRIAIVPRSETLCELTVYLNGLDETTATEADKDGVLSMTMVKIEQEWRLEKFVY